MMFEIGQQVVSIKDWPFDYRITHAPVRGQVYTIRGFCQEAMDKWHTAYLYLEEITNHIDPLSTPPIEPAFLGLFFRPVKKTSIEIFTTLLAPTPKQKVLT